MCTTGELRARDDEGQPVIDIADVADMNERLIIKAENQRRADRAAKRKAEAQNPPGRRRR